MNNTINSSLSFGAKLVISPNVKSANASRLNSIAQRFEQATKDQSRTLYVKHGTELPGSLAYVITPGTSEKTRNALMEQYSERFSDDFLTLEKDAQRGLSTYELFAEPDNNKLLDKLVEIYHNLIG